MRSALFYSLSRLLKHPDVYHSVELSDFVNEYVPERPFHRSTIGHSVRLFKGFTEEGQFIHQDMAYHAKVALQSLKSSMDVESKSDMIYRFKADVNNVIMKYDAMNKYDMYDALEDISRMNNPYRVQLKSQ